MTFLWVEAGARSFKGLDSPRQVMNLQKKKDYAMLTAELLSSHCF